jgi:hypothetical protein
VLLTQHGKETVIGPVLQRAIGCGLERVGGFDTDRLGTFTREVPRAGTQLEAARRKAEIGMQLAGCALGVGSEGAFVGDPFVAMLPWNLELVVFIDRERGLEVVGSAQGPARHVQRLLQDRAALRSVAEEADFPSHHLTLRPNGEDDPRIEKGISDWARLEAAFDRAARRASNGAVWIESDLRAFANPTRQALIEAATRDLAQRLASECPRCGSPGYWISGSVPGLPCRDCGTPTPEAVADRWGCTCCEHREERPRASSRSADPARCDYCNP